MGVRRAQKARRHEDAVQHEQHDENGQYVKRPSFTLLLRSENRRDSLAAADARRSDGESAAVAAQFVHRGVGNARARCAERMSERDRTAVRVYFVIRS